LCFLLIGILKMCDIIMFVKAHNIILCLLMFTILFFLQPSLWQIFSLYIHLPYFTDIETSIEHWPTANSGSCKFCKCVYSLM
jgi:hypothetical protein